MGFIVIANQKLLTHRAVGFLNIALPIPPVPLY